MCHPVNLDRHEVIVSDLTRMLRFPKSFADTNQAVKSVCSRGPRTAPRRTARALAHAIRQSPVRCRPGRFYDDF